MNIILVRRISQIFFFSLFIWFCIVNTVGEKWWQLRGWPVNWFLELDPLVAVGTIISTHKLHGPLLWALLTITLTIILGRFFCGWVCPFGTLHHFIGYIWHKKLRPSQKVNLNRFQNARKIKYYILIVFLAMAFFPFSSASLQTGILDPIPLFSRSVSLVLLPVFDSGVNIISATGRFYDGAWLLLSVFLAAILLNFIIPRFYCRFLCPLGALFAILSRYSLWRVGRNHNTCTDCNRCERYCEGGCEPNSAIRSSECLLCMNCRSDCKERSISYQTSQPSTGMISSPGLSRRGFVLSFASGLIIMPAFRLSLKPGHRDMDIIRPPGSIAEKDFSKRCIKCGQCMRICPTNVLQPGSFNGGFENLWTPVMNNRTGSSGCRLNCTACGQACPTSAIRPITLEEKHGKGKFAGSGPVRIGTAFVNRSRCLPWAMKTPCIVCEENCPLSPKAIYIQQVFRTVRGGIMRVKSVSSNKISFTGLDLPKNINSGDYYCWIGAKIS